MSKGNFAGQLLVLGALVLLGAISINTKTASAAVAHTYICGTDSNNKNLKTTVDTQDHIKTTWDGKGTFTITPQGQGLDHDLTLWVSSYQLTSDHYDGGCFVKNDESHGTYPQTLFTSRQVTIPAHSTDTVKVTIDMPDACYNTQVDLYRGPELKEVGAVGHEKNGFITGGIVVTQQTPACQPDQPTPPTGGQGAGTPTPPQKPAGHISAASTTTPAALPNTGPGQLIGLFTITSLAAGLFHQILARRKVFAN